MDILVFGAGLMGRAIAFDLAVFSDFKKITVVDRDKNVLKAAERFLKNKKVNFDILDARNLCDVKTFFRRYDVVISAIPYYFNYELSKTAVDSRTHFLDLGGNNSIVEKQRTLHERAKENKVLVLPDCGLAPGMTSVIARDIVDFFDVVDCIKIRVGGLPLNPVPPFNYQIVFSLHGLINEYVEDALVLDHGRIIAKKPMTELETVEFPYPFGKMEAFLTSGGCSTLPYTFKDKVGYLDYKTIRYPGHCQMFKPIFDLGLASEEPININGEKIKPRDVLIELLGKTLPVNGEDVVLMKVFSRGIRDGDKVDLEYRMIDYFDEENNMTSMMRTTGFPVSITAQMIEKGLIREHGVFCCEEIIPCKPFFEELKKRGIHIHRKISPS